MSQPVTQPTGRVPPAPTDPYYTALRRALNDVASFSRAVIRLPLRGYQLEPVRAVIGAVLAQAGGTYVIQFARQSGKDEAVAQMLAYLLLYFKNAGGKIVLAAPSAGQADISKQRLRERLDNPISGGWWQRQGIYSLQVGKASVAFLTTAESANTRGHTANRLLIGNEAQDIDAAVWDARFVPMTAATNAPILYLGTPWRSDSLLARARRQAAREQVADGQPHLFIVDWQRVAEDVPSYRDHVEARAAQLGWQHPFIKTEYQLIELDEAGRLLDPHRLAQMQGDHARSHSNLKPQTSNLTYALLLDVAGEAEAAEGEIRAANPRKDSTALTVIAFDPSTARPIYRVVDRRLWRGTKHSQLADTLVDLADHVWPAAHIVIDATGIGAGLASFLAARLRGRVTPFLFNQSSKSKLGWDFLVLVESGRYKEYAPDGAADTALFWQQAGAATYEVLAGPHKPMRWSVADPNLHDDLLISAALCATLDELDLRSRIARGRNYADLSYAGAMADPQPRRQLRLLAARP